MNGKELIKALDALVAEKNISPDVVFEALQLALQTAYKKNFNSKTNVRVDINRENGDIKVYSYLVVVPEYDDGSEEVDEEGNVKKIEPSINRDAQILLEDAEKIVPGIKVGETIENAVKEQVEKIHKYLIAFNEIIKDYYKSNLLPIYNAGYIALEKQFLTIGINGFVEAAEYLNISPTPNDEYFDFGKHILQPIYELNKRDRTKEIMFNTEFVPAENLGVKNAKWDKKDGYYVPRDCYNSYFYVVEDESTTIADKFILHGNDFLQYLDGGSALHANLSEHLTKDQYAAVLKGAIKTGCSYFTFNIPNTICNKCGHISKHMMNKCEVCGSEDVDYATRVIGYLKRISKFSEARQKEAEKRFYDDQA